VVEGFAMPVKVSVDDKPAAFVYPTEKWKTVSGKTLKADRNFYIN